MGKLEFGDTCGNDGAGISLQRTLSGKARLDMFGWGFEAYRYLDADDLREIRDWINRELGEDNA